MKKTEEYSISKFSPYVEHMVENLKRTAPAKRPVSTIQCASTQAILNRPKEKDAEHWNRPVLKEWMYNPDPKTPEEFDIAVAKRSVTLEEVVLVEGMRRSVKNTLGQQEEPSLSKELKEKAINAFYHSPPAELNQLEKARVTQMTGYTPLPYMEETKPKKRFKWFHVEHYVAVFFFGLVAAAIVFLKVVL